MHELPSLLDRRGGPGTWRLVGLVWSRDSLALVCPAVVAAANQRTMNDAGRMSTSVPASPPSRGPATWQAGRHRLPPRDSAPTDRRCPEANYGA